MEATLSDGKPNSEVQKVPISYAQMYLIMLP